MSRFIRNSDPHVEEVLGPLPKTWWSRPFEYGWAEHFAQPQATVLDAGCGVSHPFKFWLGTRCARTIACDTDARILDGEAMVAELSADLGMARADDFLRAYLPQVTLVQASLLDLPFSNQAFGRIFCISVLEHLSGQDQKRALSEFQRTLRPDGIIVLTCDHPAVNLAELQHMVHSTKLEFAGPVNFALPHDALATSGGLRCFRAALCHSGAKEGLSWQ